ncbi:MAG: hypothetical protein JWN89_395 [Parcubacteria group bacterium]|nr:hypothetical protein [Parcubacteria group bacterium]
MAFVYHIVPKGMQGTVLYPLNTLKNIFPDAYQAHVKKYEGREILLQRRIKRLGCLWNDVLHLSALNPSIVDREMRKLGKGFALSYVEIPAEKLELEKTVVYLNSPREKGTPPPEDDYLAYDPNEVEKYAYLPEATTEYYKETIEAGMIPMGFHLVPHILYKGTIDTADLKIVTV